MRFENVAEEVVSIAYSDRDVSFYGQVVFCFVEVFAFGGVDGGGMGDGGAKFVPQCRGLFLKLGGHFSMIAGGDRGGKRMFGVEIGGTLYLGGRMRGWIDGDRQSDLRNECGVLTCRGQGPGREQCRERKGLIYFRTKCNITTPDSRCHSRRSEG